MLKELEKQLVQNVRQEKERLERESRELKKKITDDKKLATAELTKERQVFEEYINKANKDLTSRENVLAGREIELSTIKKERNLLTFEIDALKVEAKKVNKKKKDIAALEVSLSNQIEAANKKEELYETRLSNMI